MYNMIAVSFFHERGFLFKTRVLGIFEFQDCFLYHLICERIYVDPMRIFEILIHYNELNLKQNQILT